MTNQSSAALSGEDPAKSQRNLLRQMPGFVALLAGPDHVYDCVNEAYTAISGPPGLVGRSVRDVLPERIDPQFHRLLDQAYVTGQPFTAQAMPIHRTSEDGDRPIDLLYQPIRDDEGTVTFIFVARSDETARLRSNVYGDALAMLTDRIADLTDPEAVAATAATILGETLKVSRVGYGTIDADAETLHVRQDWTAPQVESLAGVTPLRDYGAFIDSLRRGEFISIADVTQDERTASAASALQARNAFSFVNVPVIEKDRLVAVLYVNHGAVRSWLPDELGFIKEIASRTRAAVERCSIAIALRESEARYRTLFDTIDEGFCVIEFIDGPHGPLSDYVHVQANPAYTANAGIPDIVGKRLREIVADEADRWAETYRQVLLTGHPLHFERELEATGRCLELSAFRVEPAGKQQVAVLFQDVTARKQAERRLHELNETLESQVIERTAERDRMWDTSPDLMLVVDFDGVIRRINPAWTARLGYTAEDIIGRQIETLGLADDQTKTADAFAGQSPLLADRYRHKDGSVRYISWVSAPAGNMTYAIGRDVTDERERATLLRRFQDIVEATVSPICAFDHDYRLIAFNRAHNDEFRRVNGFETRIGDVFPDLFIAEQRGIMRALMTRALSGESFTIVEAFGRPELGTPCWEISYTPLRDATGRIIGAFHQAKDISERLLAEAELVDVQEALRQSQKMDAMGQLTGGVAHDFNNLLTPIIGSLDMLMRKGIGSERERRLIDGALQSAERARILVQRLLAFARRQPLQPIPVDLRRLIGDMVGLLESTLGPTIDVRVDLAADLPPAKADPNQLEMALLNLAVNARDAMPDGGGLTIAARRASVRGAHPLGLQSGHYVVLAIRDTGFGMDEATLRRATEPFFSTKGIGKGTGLGLSMVHGLAAQLGGGLSIVSVPDEGTTIELWLPISVSEIEDEHQRSEPSPAPKRAGIALLVDDEELVRMSAADMLSDLGYDVVEAGSAEEALRLIHTGLSPDLLVTDHLMPGMSGAQLAQDVRSKWPGLPVLIVSGYAEVDGIDPGVARLTKPFRSVDLAASLSALLG